MHILRKGKIIDLNNTKNIHVASNLEAFLSITPASQRLEAMNDVHYHSVTLNQASTKKFKRDN